jgi:hypothetical protein
MIPTPYLDSVHGAIGIGMRHGLLTPFVIGGDSYIAIAQVKGASNQFVCLSMTKSDQPHALQLATISPRLSAFAVHFIEPDGPQVKVEPESAQLTCHILALMALSSLDDAHDEQLPADHSDRDMLEGLVGIVVHTALTAGAFGNSASVVQLMEFGKSARAPRGLRWLRHEDRHAERLRAACRPDDREAIRAYATFLVYIYALSVYERRIGDASD